MTALVVDANIILSALLGRSLPTLEDIAGRGVELFVPVIQWIEVQAVLRHLRPESVNELMTQAAAFVDILPLEAFVPFEGRARERLENGQEDWAVLASAMALEAGIWSKDRDFFGVGVPVWTTSNIRFVEGGR
ncbi:PIN domain-containing protein [Sphingomonas gilva]|uniref:PIN domain-containing protein n=1 Tax=Sphingomonas gilva TaxID=2305907 RepID=A0A396RRB9_9SPHN|nr:PIN domain-containing protein [Sphingomonas gilva]RHW19184.1 PIN domain-containing protein [Sphingomonas gilva]